MVEDSNFHENNKYEFLFQPIPFGVAFFFMQTNKKEKNCYSYLEMKLFVVA